MRSYVAPRGLLINPAKLAAVRGGLINPIAVVRAVVIFELGVFERAHVGPDPAIMQRGQIFDRLQKLLFVVAREVDRR